MMGVSLSDSWEEDLSLPVTYGNSVTMPTLLYFWRYLHDLIALVCPWLYTIYIQMGEQKIGTRINLDVYKWIYNTWWEKQTSCWKQLFFLIHYQRTLNPTSFLKNFIALKKKKKRLVISLRPQAVQIHFPWLCIYLILKGIYYLLTTNILS